MENSVAKVLDSCTIADFLDTFDGSTKKEALAARSAYNELNLSKLRTLLISESNIMLNLIERYNLKDVIKLQDVRNDILSLTSETIEVNYETFNQHVINVFMICEMSVDKKLSMLDFYQLEQNATKIAKK